MKIVEIRNLRTDARNKWDYADAFVESGFLWWRKVRVAGIFRRSGSGLWRWADTGKFTPEFQAENLVLALQAMQDMP